MGARLLEYSQLGAFLTFALTTPLGVPAILVLVEQWRFPRRRIMQIMVAIYLFLVVAFTIIYVTLGVSPLAISLVAAGTPVLCWLLFILCVKHKDGRLFFCIITGLLLAFSTEAMASMLVQRGTLLWVLAKVTLTGVQWVLLYFFGRKPFYVMLRSSEGWLRMCLPPFAMLLCLMTGYLRPVIRDGLRPDPVPALLLMAAILLMYMLIYHLVVRTHSQNRANYENSLMRTHVKFLAGQVEHEQRRDAENSTFRHDVRHYINMLRGCMDNNDQAAARQVLQSMEETLDALGAGYALQCYTGDAVIDTVLSLAGYRAREADIEYQVRMTLPQDERIDRVELAVVLSNALENATNACLAQPQGHARKICISGAQQKQQYLLLLANTCEDDVVFDPVSGLPVTEEKGHGYGVQSIAAFSKKYSAQLEWKVEDGWFRMWVLI